MRLKTPLSSKSIDGYACRSIKIWIDIHIPWLEKLNGDQIFQRCSRTRTQKDLVVTSHQPQCLNSDPVGNETIANVFLSTLPMVQYGSARFSIITSDQNCMHARHPTPISNYRFLLSLLAILDFLSIVAFN